MTETAQPVSPSGPSSTPDPGTTPAAQPAAAAAPSPEPKPADPPAATPAEAAKPADAKPADQPLFTLPDDMQVPDGARTKFEAAIKGKTKDGRLELTAQDVIDMYVDQARDAATLWGEQVKAQDAEWKTASEKRFTKDQLAASETGVGFLSSFDPAFREVVKGIANHPTFVNAMRVIGERLSEDTFEIEGSRATPARKAAADVLYGKRN